MNQRKIGTLLSYAYIIITNTISLIYTPYMLRMMGQSEYGLYGTASSFIAYLSILSFGIAGSYIRFNAQCRADNDREGEKKLNGMFLLVFSFLSLLVIIGGLIMTVLVGKMVANTFSAQELFKLRVIMVLLTFNSVISFMFNVVMMALQAYEKFICIRIVLLLAGIINPVLNVIALKLGGRSITISCISVLISVLSYIIFYVYARKTINLQFCFTGLEFGKLKAVFLFSSYLFLNSLTDQITFSTDNVILSSVKGSAAVAVYTVGSSFKVYFQNFSTSISSVFAPMINQTVAKKEEVSVLDELFIRIGRIQFYVVSLILIGYCIIGQEFITLWAGDDYKDAYWIGLLLMLSVFVPSFQNVGLEIQKAKNMHKARSVVYFFIALINVVMTIPMSRMWSGIGAAAATTICMFAGTVIFMNIYYYKYVGINIPAFWKSIFSILPGYIAPIIIGIIARKFIPIHGLLEFFYKAIFIIISFAVSIWLFSMNKYEKELIKRPFYLLVNKYHNTGERYE